jgi:shikimate kinase
VGKTAVGAELAALLRVPFFDLDQEIEAFFQKPIARLQAETITMERYRRKAAEALKSLFRRDESRNCVIALPPSSLMTGYSQVVGAAGGTVVVLEDEPENILDRIVFYDDDSRPIARKLLPAERRYYLSDISKDIAYFRRSYKKADLSVHIGGLGILGAAQKIKAALDAYLKQPGRGRDRLDGCRPAG